MDTKFKVGDKVLLNKPKERGVEDFIWISSMDKFDGEVFVVKEIGGRGGRYYCTNDETDFFLPESWLTKLEEQQNEQVAEHIDWEKRRWELASKLFSLTSHEQAISSADNFIEQYKQTLK